MFEETQILVSWGEKMPKSCKATRKTVYVCNETGGQVAPWSGNTSSKPKAEAEIYYIQNRPVVKKSEKNAVDEMFWLSR